MGIIRIGRSDCPHCINYYFPFQETHSANPALCVQCYLDGLLLCPMGLVYMERTENIRRKFFFQLQNSIDLSGYQLDTWLFSYTKHRSRRSIGPLIGKTKITFRLTRFIKASAPKKLMVAPAFLFNRRPHLLNCKILQLKNCHLTFSTYLCSVNGCPYRAA